jgi:hydroxymethylpyrimidine/phosphomethylpyrimidine kinase
MPTPPVVLTIAGFDPSSGAGVTADLKTIAAHGCYGAACITALTVQNTQGVRHVEALAPALIWKTLEALADDLPIAAVKVGMLGSGTGAEAVADWLESARPPNVVVDPVIRSSSGADLLDSDGLQVVRERLLKIATVITPNLAEAAALTGLGVTNVDEMRVAATALHEAGAANVVITGGHLEEPVDLLRTAGEFVEYTGEKVESTSTHGTGCAFATSLACNLALGRPMRDAVALAKEFVLQGIRNAYPLGHGHGPLNHLWRFRL